MKKLIFITLGLLAIGVPVGLYFGGFLGGHAEEGAEGSTAGGHGPAQQAPLYLPLDPPFVVNFMHRGTLRYLQVSLEVMYRSDGLLTKVKNQMPAIRNELILMFSNQEFEQLNSLEGKEALRTQVRNSINRIIGQDEAAPDKGEVYITSFIMQ